MENLNLRGDLGKYLLLVFVLLAAAGSVQAQAPLLSLEVESTNLNWQDEFVLKLSIYAPENMELPAITIDGMDQFKLQGTGKNLFQIPRGKTKRWVLTYTLIASDTGNFKVGPAVVIQNGRTYRSNIVFLNVEGPRNRRSEIQQTEPEKPPVEPPKTEKKAPVEPPKKEKRQPVQPPEKEKRQPVEPPKEEKKAPPVQDPKPAQKQIVKPPVPEPKPTPKPAQQQIVKPPVEEPKPVPKQVIKPPAIIDPSTIGDQILILMEIRKQNPYQLQGVPVTVRLLSQIPVENLQFLEEADFPGFLRYDFPFTSKPKGEVVEFRNKAYASFELVKFLLFPLEGGEIQIPAVKCELRVRVPSEDFAQPDSRVTLQRSSNLVTLRVKPSPKGAVVGDFVFRNEIIADESDSKVLRMVLEGTGQLSTFDFPELTGPQFTARTLNVSTTAKIHGEKLLSKKIQDVEILPAKSTASVVLPALVVREFDPDSGNLAALKLPPMRFQFQFPGSTPPAKLEFPEITGVGWRWLFLGSLLVAIFLYFKDFRPAPKPSRVRLQKLFRKKNLKLHISRSAARGLYQQITAEIARHEKITSSVVEALTRHMPQEEWLNVSRGLRKLERTAYSATKPADVTYAEMKQLCEKIEVLWIQ